MIVLTMHSTPDDIRRWRRTRAWRNLAARIVMAHPICHLQLPGICTRRSTTADHIIPVATRPDLAMEPTNCLGACKPCNDWRQDMPLAQVRAMIAAGEIKPRRANQSRARRHMTARRRPSRAAQSFFTTTGKPLQHNEMRAS